MSDGEKINSNPPVHCSWFSSLESGQLEIPSHVADAAMQDVLSAHIKPLQSATENRKLIDKRVSSFRKWEKVFKAVIRLIEAIS